MGWRWRSTGEDGTEFSTTSSGCCWLERIWVWERAFRSREKTFSWESVLSRREIFTPPLGVGALCAGPELHLPMAHPLSLLSPLLPAARSPRRQRRRARDSRGPFLPAVISSASSFPRSLPPSCPDPALSQAPLRRPPQRRLAPSSSAPASSPTIPPAWIRYRSFRRPPGSRVGGSL